MTRPISLFVLAALGAVLLVPLATAADHLTIHRLEVCAEVVDREPVGAAETFPEDIERVYGFTEVRGGEEGDSVTHVWLREGEEIARVKLPVKSAKWRTWSSKRIPGEWAGEWKLVVLDAEGNELAATEFRVGS